MTATVTETETPHVPRFPPPTARRVRSPDPALLVLAGRTVTKIKRSPEQLLDVTLQPIIFTVLFVYLFGGAISGSQHAYLQFVLPAILVQTVLFFATLAIGVNLNTDIGKGVFDRFRSCPSRGRRRWSEPFWGMWSGSSPRSSCSSPSATRSVSGSRPTCSGPSGRSRWCSSSPSRSPGSPSSSVPRCATRARCRASASC